MSGTNSPKPGLTRRAFLKTTAVVGGASAILGATSLTALADDTASTSSQDDVYHVVCRINCNVGSCGMDAHVRNGKLVKTTTMRNPTDEHWDRRPCLRGRSHLQWIYNEHRIKYPMRRVEGTERGAGEWERISWDEAIDEIASKFTDIIEQYGPQAISFPSLTADMGSVPQGINTSAGRFRNIFGMTNVEYCLDFATLVGISRVTKNIPSTNFGHNIDAATGNPLSDAQNSKTLVVWGANPSESWIHEWHWVCDAVEAGAKLVVVDPRFSTTASKADKFFPVKVATDTPLVLSMIKIIIDRQLYDKKFIIERTVSPFLVREDNGQFLRASDLGVEPVKGPIDKKTGKETLVDPCVVWDSASSLPCAVDAAVDPALTGSYTIQGIKVRVCLDLIYEASESYTIEKTSAITSLTPEQIEDLVDIYVNQKPVYTHILYGVDRFCDGDVTAHALTILSALTGNIGVRGGSFGVTWGASAGFYGNTAMVTPEGTPGMEEVPWLLFHDILKSGYYGEGDQRREFPIKAMMTLSGNPINNNVGLTECVEETLPMLDFVVTVDSIMSDTAQYSDIVLPACHWFEFEGIVGPGAGTNHFAQFSEKAIEPLYESKTNTEIFRLLAKKMGAGKYYPDDLEQQIMESFFDNDICRTGGYTLDRLKSEKTIFTNPSFDCEKPDGRTSWPTPTGRMELYQPNPVPRFDWGQKIDVDFYRLPRYRPQTEVSVDSEPAAKYPIVNMNEHGRFRVHSSFGRNEWLRELDPEPVIYLSRLDSEQRGIRTGDYVRAYNDHGSCTLKAVVDDSLPAGLSNIPKGWSKDQTIEGHYNALSYRYINSVTANQQFAEQRIEIEKTEVSDHA
ncbi:molybdopterin-dependent oxidoreductase [Gordonibacter sp. 28C]|uniref:molybdopterin-dependent oxidoreductase n=1 Tax=Gordonibacter sp. 28C TaxID=2078569 RepID=UPI0013140BEF|nr:molybdopterin-dependent oxidoreductase [Gordonibacter sp. 28C]